MYEVTFNSAIRNFDGTLEVGSVDPDAPFALLTADDAPVFLFRSLFDALSEVTATIGLDYAIDAQDEWTEYTALSEVSDPDTGRVATLTAVISKTIY